MAESTDEAARAFYELSKRLKEAGPGVRKEFLKDMREAAKPLLPLVSQAALERFPKRGGLNRHMARKSRYRTVARTGVTTAGVSIRANKTDPRLDTEGRVVHPVPNGRGDWLRHPAGTKRAGQRVMEVQTFPEVVGFFSDTIAQRDEAIRADLIQRLERWALENLAGDIHG
jgi:hypothetical protein